MESIGQTLKAARERRQMVISDVVTATKMTSTFVSAIEADNFGALVAPIYARGFIKLYAECVGLDPMPLLKQFSTTYRAVPTLSQPTIAAHSAPAPSKALGARAGKLKSKPALEVVSGQSKAVGGATLTAATPVSEGRLSALNWTFIARIRWPQFRKLNEMFRQAQLPLMVWRRIFIVAGVALLIIVASLAWEWSSRGMPAMTDACRWLAEPPAPYLTMEARPAPSMKTP